MITGQQLTATLRLVRPLGQGAMGSVWVADHATLGVQVAVKFMAPALVQEPGLAERFRREAMAAAQIKNPHVAQVFDHGETSAGVPYILMELLEGEPLERRIDRLGWLPAAEVARVVHQAAKALGRAHQLGIVHRDVKPDNLFAVDLDGEVFIKVLDFGVAKLEVGNSVGATATGTMIGTPLYMSPEQLLSSKHVDHRADLWSLAVVAYRALTGQVPFMGETLAGLAIAINEAQFTPVRAHRPELPPAVDAWMAKALHRDVNARFSSAKELAEALAQALGTPIFGAVTSDPGVSTGAKLLRTARLEGAGGGAGQDGSPLAGSGATATTFEGAASTGGHGKRPRWAVAVVLAAAAFAVAIAAVFAVKQGGGGARDDAGAPPGVESGGAAAQKVPDPAAPPPSIAPAAPASAAPAEATAAPAEATTASAAASARLQRPILPSRPASTAAATRQEPAARPTPVKREDDIGF